MVDIKQWAGRNDERKYLNQPFNIIGQTVATSGHVMIIVDKDDIYGELPSGRVSSIRRVVEEVITTNGDFKPFDKSRYSLPESHPCGVCKSTGSVEEISCEECRGRGEITLDNDYHEYSHECKTCDGRKVYRPPQGICPSCDGFKVSYDRNARVEVDGVLLDPRYFDLLWQIEDLTVCGVPDRWLLFRSPIYIGAIMRMRNSDE